MVVLVAVSRWRSVMKPPRTEAPLSNAVALLPKWAPPSTDLNNPDAVATSNVPEAGMTMRTMATPVKIPPGFNTVQVSPPSSDL
jgi:hypothetical protein